MILLKKLLKSNLLFKYSLTWSVQKTLAKNINSNTSESFLNPTLNIFDRKAKLIQKERSVTATNSEIFNYLKEEIGERLSDRLYDVKREFNSVLDLGCGSGHISKRITGDNVKKLICMDVSKLITNQSTCDDTTVELLKLVGDEENLLKVLDPESLDLVISNLALHWVNDLPQCFDQIIKTLKKDGVFMASIFGGDTLFELRSSLQLAELERLGGIAPHVSPFTRVRDLGGLLNRAGFTMQTIDTDEITVGYPSMLDLMLDLKGMGENNCAWNRKLNLRKDVILAASAIYNELYGKEEDGRFFVPATYQIMYFVGWKPDPTQPQPMTRGTGEISLKDLHKLDEIVKKRGHIPTEDGN